MPKRKQKVIAVGKVRKGPDRVVKLIREVQEQVRRELQAAWWRRAIRAPAQGLVPSAPRLHRQ